MQKVLRYLKRIGIGLLFFIVIGYLIFMAVVESPFTLDITSCIKIDPIREEIELPWYLQVLLKPGYYTWDGIDLNEKRYSLFDFMFPSIFEDTEMFIMVSWTELTAVALVGESRGLDPFTKEYSTIQWVLKESQ